MSWKKGLKKWLVSDNMEINEQDFRKIQELTKDLYYAMRAFQTVESQQWQVEPATPEHGEYSKITGKLATDYSTALKTLYDFWNSLDRPINEG